MPEGADRSRGRAFMQRMRSKYRLVVTNAETFQEVWGMRLSRLNFLVSLGVFFLVLMGLSWVLIVFTPIREFIPGQSRASLTQDVVGNALRADSLNREMELWSNYLSNLRLIFGGGTPEPYLLETDSVENVRAVALARSKEDSLFRLQIEREMQLASAGIPRGERDHLELIAPLRGDLTAVYDPAKGHLGVDIVARPNAPILALADGVVVMTSYDMEYGFILVIQYASGLVSVYKHCRELLKTSGNAVRAGDVVAIIGNSGRLTSGPHLHFELWYKGNSLNPEHYIVFR